MPHLNLDLTGNNPDNLIMRIYPISQGIPADKGEVFVPEYGVFFTKNLVVKHADTNTTLVLNRDYYLTYYSKHLKSNYNLEGFAGVVLTNKTLTGNIEITCQYVGGGYIAYNPTYIKNTVDLINGVPEALIWDNVLDAPGKANPEGHKVPAENITTGYQDFVAMLWTMLPVIQELAKSQDTTRIPIGAKIEVLEFSQYLNMTYWVKADGSTINRADYPIFFEVLAISGDTYTLPNNPLTLIRVK